MANYFVLIIRLLLAVGKQIAFGNVPASIFVGFPKNASTSNHISPYHDLWYFLFSDAIYKSHSLFLSVKWCVLYPILCYHNMLYNLFYFQKKNSHSLKIDANYRFLIISHISVCPGSAAGVLNRRMANNRECIA